MNARLIVAVVAIIIACVPIAFIATILLSPFWSWIEATYGIESIGHSGPSDWCFYLVYGLLTASALIAFYSLRRQPY